jgi:hypothetical protein
VTVLRGRGVRVTGRATAVLVAAAVMAACGTSRNGLGTSSSPCYKAIPVVSDAVHDRGTLAGIRLFSGSQIDHYTRLLQVLDAAAGHKVTQVCVASFHGQYTSADVSKPIVSPSAVRTGKVAVVFVSYPDNKLLGTIVLSREPLPLRHVVLGVPPAPGRAPPPAT